VSLKWMNLEEAIIQVGRAAMQAELDECPDYNMKFFLDFLKLCDREIQKRAAAQSQLAGAAGGAQGLAAVNAGGAAPGTVASGPMPAGPVGVAA